MAHPGLSTINTSKRKKKISAAQKRAALEHESWLKSQGLHPDQLSSRTKNTDTFKYKLSVDKDSIPCSNGFAPGGAKKSVFDSQWKKTYEDDPLLAEREAAALEKAKAMKANLMPLYNKGPIQLNTGLKAHELGKRR
jgi:hypothetical protein